MNRDYWLPFFGYLVAQIYAGLFFYMALTALSWPFQILWVLCFAVFAGPISLFCASRLGSHDAQPR